MALSAILPALKAIVPHLAGIIASVVPAFTTKKSFSDTSDPNARVILEIQDAVTVNAESIKSLAEQLQQTVATVAELSASIEERLTTQEKAIVDIKIQVIQSKHEAKQAYISAIASILIAVFSVAFVFFRHAR